MRALRPICMLLAVVALLQITACGRRLRESVAPARTDQVALTWRRLTPANADSMRYRVAWRLVDPGAAAHQYRYAVDPPDPTTPDRSWATTRSDAIILSFPAARDARTRGSVPPDSATHLFAICAVDRWGRTSPVTMRTLSPTNIAPSVQIDNPIPSLSYSSTVLPTVFITWHGSDPDGIFTQYPVKYKYKLLNGNDPLVNGFLLDPNSMLAYYAPTFAGWDSTSGDTTSVQFTNLNFGQTYLFAIIAIDEAGAWTETFSLTTNMLRMHVALYGSIGPLISVYDEYFHYDYQAGGIYPGSPVHPSVQLPADVPVRMSWSAEPIQGNYVVAYRWAVDIADINDETARPDELKDTQYWSQWSLNVTDASFGPFSPPGVKREAHRFYVEAKDNAGFVSLGIVKMAFDRPELTNELLIVDDTRLLPDQEVSFGVDSVRAPVGAWPTAAELDTFLFARGGFPWRYYPAGSMSSPGVFKGYRFDTLGTRFLPGHIVPLAILNQYRHVIWYTDRTSATLIDPNSVTQPITGLRWMCTAGQENVLALYVSQGGKLWLLGGGAAMASLVPLNCASNDAAGWTIFTDLPCSGRPAELQSGRMMFDFAHWTGGIQCGSALNQIQKSARAIGGWPGAPDHALLPSAMHPKSLPSDTVPPLRTPSSFLNPAGRLDIELLSQPSELPCENVGPPGGPKFCGSPLDTLMVTSGSGQPVNPGGNPCMTWYHGTEHGQFIFSGFNIWSFHRDDCVLLTDFVLHEIWGLNRESAPAFSATLRRPPVWTPPAQRAARPAIHPTARRP